MIGISKTEASFVQKCLEKKQYFLTNYSFRQFFSDLSEKALYQMIYRLKKKGVIYSLMNGQYLVRPLEEWLLGSFSSHSFNYGLLSYLNSINGVISGSSAYYFLKKNQLPRDYWNVTTLESIIRTRVFEAGGFSKKIKFSYSKKIFDKVVFYKIEDVLIGNLKSPLRGDYKYIPEGYTAIESIF